MSLTGYNLATISNPLTATNYRHVALSISGTTHTLYLDGSVVATNPNAGDIFTSYTSAINNLYIGCAGDLSYGYNGIIDDFKIWNRALSTADISAIYLSNPSVDLPPSDYVMYYPLTAIVSSKVYNAITGSYDGSVSTNNINFPPTISTTIFKFSNASLQLSRTYTQYVSLSSDFTNGNNFSFCVWFRVSPFGSSIAQYIFNIGPNMLNNDIGAFVNTGSLNLTLMNGAYSTTGGKTGDQSILSISNHIWYHLAWIVTGTTWNIYINGSLHTTKTNMNSPPTTARSVQIGQGYNNQTFNGNIQDFRIYNRRLTNTEVTNIYNFTGF